MKTELKKNDPAKAHRFFADKLAFTTGPVELNRAISEGADIAVIDVREAEDYQKGHIPRAINLPKSEWDSRRGLRRDALNVLYCYTHVCHLAATAAVEFAADGYSVMEMDGGLDAWKENELEVSTEEARTEPVPVM
jgi:rhodanese-related sulfurtransferase